MSEVRHLYLPVIIAVGFAVAATSVLPDAQAFDSPKFVCSGSDNWMTPTDFRLRNSTRKLKFKFEDGKRNHLDPAISRMDNGQYNLYVLSDLEFLLRRWPNHHLALQALVRFEAGGGRPSPQRPTTCYFELAQRFAPDDVNILILRGIYFHGKGEYGMAEAAWLGALQINAGSPDAHYSLGLLYFNTGRTDDALEHAIAAYDAGYPLPGLKNKLVKAGKWTGKLDQ